MATEQLIREFLAEAEEHVLTLEPNLLRLEQEPANRELIDEIFLATHSMKGTAAYVGLAHISSFLHTVESLLEPVRTGSAPPSPEFIDALLLSVDALKELIRHVAEGKSAPDTSQIVAQLSAWHAAVTQPNHVDEAAAASVGAPEREDCEIFADISRQQLELMRLTFDKVRSEKARASSQGGTLDVEAMRAYIAAIVAAFRKIQSSAAVLHTDHLDAALAEHACAIATLESAEQGLTDDELAAFTRRMSGLESVIADLCAWSKAASPVESPLPPPAAVAPGSPAVEWSRGRSFLRVDAARVDDLLNFVGELVITRARLADIGKEIKTIYDDLRTGERIFRQDSGLQRKKDARLFKKLKERLDETTGELGRLTNQMQEATMRIRMVPISQVVSHFPRMVRDLARQAGKEVQIMISGAETELDKTVIDLIGEPLIHLLRNAIDHGIEAPEERVRHGKPRQGTITLAAYHEGNQVILAVKDDGRGLDRQRITQKAVQLRVISPQQADDLPEREALALIFTSGLSTVDAVSSLSGRGVGLNVVKRAVEKISGSIDLDARPGQGCAFFIKLPLTLAIIPALLVSVGSDIFAMPLMAVEEAIRFGPRDVHTIETQRVIRLRDRMIPVFDLTDLLGTPGLTSAPGQTHEDAAPALAETEAHEEAYYGVILSDGDREIGLVVDALLGEGDMVIKPLRHELLAVEGVSGASIRGDGQVALVIDAAALINLALTRVKEQRRARYAGGRQPGIGRGA